MAIAPILLILGLIGCANAGQEPLVAAQAVDEAPTPSPLAPIHPKCLPGKTDITKKVTHYYVPLLEKYNEFTCNKMEGTCIFKRSRELWLHNYGYPQQKLKDARCKNGYGNRANCLNPCRTIAASTRHHRTGEVFFMKELVGKRCGNQSRDGFEMIHDGFVYVGDTGAPSHFNETGRFDFFWGRCKNKRSGVCFEGAHEISEALTRSEYCMVWNPMDPLKNEDVKVWYQMQVRDEAIFRADPGAASDFDLDRWVGKGTD